MSFWRKLFRGTEPEAEPEPATLSPEVEVDPRDPKDPERLLEEIGSEPRAQLDEEHVLELIESLRGRGREARAVDLSRRILSHERSVGAHRKIHQRVAEILASRGDDEGAYKLVAELIADANAPLDLCMLAAEICQRRSDTERALALYERVLALDLDYPRARARVRRLRDGDRREADIGATLMADGALTRGRYRIERELGRGGAGTVFLAEDLSLGRKLALKVYHRRGRSERTRLLVEGRLPARFEHPGIVRVFDLDESLAAIAMERVLGGSVRQELTKGRLGMVRISRWFETAVEALAAVHERGFVHRDIKPSNMLLRSDDRVVLTDFGIACEKGAFRVDGGAEGTLAYMAPEQRSGAPASGAMDVYAFGVTVNEVLEHADSEPPERFAELAAACMRSEPTDRPKTTELRGLLAEAGRPG